MNSINFSLILDLIVVAIILFCILHSAKKGFVKVVVGVVGLIAAYMLAFTVSTPLANITYDKFIEPAMVNAVNESTDTQTDSAQTKAWDAIPEFITKNAEKYGVSLSEFSESVTENISNGAETAVIKASQDVIKPISIKIIGLIYSVVLMTASLFVVRILAKFINKLFSFNFIGKVNRILGGIIGIFKGIIFAVFFCAVISLIVSFTKNGFLIFTPENINGSFIFKGLANLIPFNIF